MLNLFFILFPLLSGVFLVVSKNDLVLIVIKEWLKLRVWLVQKEGKKQIMRRERGKTEKVHRWTQRKREGIERNKIVVKRIVCVLLIIVIRIIFFIVRDIVNGNKIIVFFFLLGSNIESSIGLDFWGGCSNVHRMIIHSDL